MTIKQLIKEELNVRAKEFIKNKIKNVVPVEDNEGYSLHIDYRNKDTEQWYFTLTENGTLLKYNHYWFKEVIEDYGIKWGDLFRIMEEVIDEINAKE